MKVLLVHNSYQQPGGEDTVFEQEREMLERAGHRVLVYRRSNWEIEGYSATRKVALAKQVIWATDSREEISRTLRREKPEVVHVHNTFMVVSPSIYSACRELQIPVVQTLHNYRLFCPAATFFREGQVCEECADYGLWRGVRYGCYRESYVATAAVALMLEVHRWRRTWTEMVNGYVALTQFARQKFIGRGLPAEKISVKPNFVHPDPGERTGRGEYALFVGRLSPEKGLRTLLAAWGRVRGHIPLVIVGDGQLRAQLEEEVAQRGLSSISFRGRLPSDEKWAAIKRARFLIFPSECYENFPLAIAESFACGIPVICSRLGAMQEVVADGCTGLHFTPGDPADLATKVEWAWALRGEMEVMGRKARGEYEAKYASGRNYEMLMLIYQRTIRSVALALPTL